MAASEPDPGEAGSDGEHLESGPEDGADLAINSLATLGIADVSARLTKGMASYEKNEWLCYSCDNPNHLYAKCPLRGMQYDSLCNYNLNGKGGPQKQGAWPPKPGKPDKTMASTANHPAVEKSS